MKLRFYSDLSWGDDHELRPSEQYFDVPCESYESDASGVQIFESLNGESVHTKTIACTAYAWFEVVR